MYKLLWSARTNNRKTGDIPTAAIGLTKEETWESCNGCALRDSKDCYAWYGTMRVGHANVLKGFKSNPSNYTFAFALANRNKSARMVRVGSIGDPSRASHYELREVEKACNEEGLAFIGYTHMWRDKANDNLSNLLMASCDNVSQADEAVEKGWRATTIVPWDMKEKRFITPAGNVAVVCPAQTSEAITCNICRLCEATRDTPFSVIAFKAHGPKERQKIRKAKKLKVI